MASHAPIPRPRRPYLFRDTFGGSQSAPLGIGRVASPGPGGWSIIDTANKASLSSGLTWTSSNAAADPGFLGRGLQGQPFTRVPGRALLCTLTTNAYRHIFGWYPQDPLTGTAYTYAFDLTSSGNWPFFIPGGSTVAQNITAVAPFTAQFAIVLRTTGAFYLVNGGPFSGWSLVWVEPSGTASPLYLAISSRTSSSAVFSAVRVVDLAAQPWGARQWGNDYAVATFQNVISTGGQTGAMATGDGLVEHTITAATGVTQELMVRRTDDNNCWIVRMAQGGSTIALIEKNAGGETSRGSVAQTWTNGTSYRIVAGLFGTKYQIFVDGTRKINFTSGTGFNTSVTGAKVSTAGSQFIGWPSLVTLPTGV